MSKGIIFSKKDGSKLKIGIVTAEWNRAITGPLFDACNKALQDSGVKAEHIFAIDVPGSFELPLGAKYLIDTHGVDAVVCLGCLVKGETMHFEYIAEAVSHGIMNLGLDTGIPVVFGVLACLTEAQAIARSTGDNNHGYGWGKTAVEMALLKNI